jgi:hypothetical protein
VRLLGVILVLVGLVAAVVGTFSGCGSLFSWNGRHAIETLPLGDTATRHTLSPEPGRRYTLSVEAVFDREGLPKREGIVEVDAKMPLVATVKDSGGTTLASVAGWLDPKEPPSVLRGQSVRDDVRGPLPELVAARIVGPFTAASSAPLQIDVNLGPDRTGTARITQRRLVIHDDALPPTIRNAFIIAVAGALAFVAGGIVLVLGWFRRRAPRRVSV